MLARFVAAVIAIAISMDGVAQSRSNLTRHGNVDVLEVSSAELPELLQEVRKRTAIGFANRWEMPADVLSSDVVIADVIEFERGKKLVLAPRFTSDAETVLFVARTIRVKGSAGDPVRMVWARNIAGQIVAPIRVGKASPGRPGDREGADGTPGADGVVGNRGFKGRDAPTLAFIALKLEADGPVEFELAGQDGGVGGEGQDGGDGGAGRPGRPGSVAGSGNISLQIKRAPQCTPPVHGGNGGNGGNGGPGGDGGWGGDGGNIILAALEIDRNTVYKFIHRNSTLAAGGNGGRGQRGLGGRGGSGAPAVLAAAPCEPSRAGKDGAPGRGRDERHADPAPPAAGGSRSGVEGAVIFSRLNKSQAESIGLIVEKK